MRKLGIIILMLCFSLCAGAQIKVVPREMLESVNNPRLSVNASSLKFETTAIQAEPMSEDDGIRKFVFPFENTGKDTIVIRRLVSTCSCAIASCEAKVLQPGESSEVVVNYNPKGHPGRFERKIFLYTGSESSPSAVLRLNVNVERGSDQSGLYPVSMGNIRLRRKEISVDKGCRSVERCVFVNVSGNPLRLQCEKAMLPACLEFRSEPDVVVAGEEGEIVITYDPSKGGQRSRMPVILKGLGVPPSQSTIVVTVKE